MQKFLFLFKTAATLFFAGVFLHFSLAGCQITHTGANDDRVVKTSPVAVSALVNNTDLYHDTDVMVSGEVVAIGGPFYSILMVKHYTLRTPSGVEVDVFPPDWEAVPNVGRKLTVYGRFQQRTYYAHAGLPCALFEFYRTVDAGEAPEQSGVETTLSMQ